MIPDHCLPFCLAFWGWLGGTKVSCILCHRGIQMIMAYSWARPVILAAGKDRGEMFYFFSFFTFIRVPLSSMSLSFISSTICSICFLPFSGRWHKMTHKGWRVIKPNTIKNQLLFKQIKMHLKVLSNYINSWSLPSFLVNFPTSI